VQILGTGTAKNFTSTSLIFSGGWKHAPLGFFGQSDSEAKVLRGRTTTSYGFCEKNYMKL